MEVDEREKACQLLEEYSNRVERYRTSAKWLIFICIALAIVCGVFFIKWQQVILERDTAMSIADYYQQDAQHWWQSYQQHTTSQPPAYNLAPAIQDDSQRQLELKRQQREQRQEYLYAQADMYDNMAKDIEVRMEYASQEERDKLAILASQYRKQAKDYRWEAFHQPMLQR